VCLKAAEGIHNLPCAFVEVRPKLVEERQYAATRRREEFQIWNRQSAALEVDMPPGERVHLTKPKSAIPGEREEQSILRCMACGEHFAGLIGRHEMKPEISGPAGVSSRFHRKTFLSWSRVKDWPAG
jgi:hypothetical protein